MAVSFLFVNNLHGDIEHILSFLVSLLSILLVGLCVRLLSLYVY